MPIARASVGSYIQGDILDQYNPDNLLQASCGEAGEAPRPLAYDVEKCMGLDRVVGDATLFGPAVNIYPETGRSTACAQVEIGQEKPSLRSLGLESIFDPPLRVNVQVDPCPAYR
jgi:hypothetical protein